MVISTRLRTALFGAGGGLIAALLSEVVLPFETVYVSTSFTGVLVLDFVWGAICGAFIGAGLGLTTLLPLVAEARTLIRRTLTINALVGFVGGGIGLILAELAYQKLGGIPFIARCIGYAVFGVALGLAQGILRRSVRGAFNAALGGLIGGGIGGFLFDVIGLVLRSGSSRVVAITIIGFFIGLFIIILQTALAKGLLKVLSGRMEGREFYLDKPMLTIGRGERCDIPLFGDSDVQPQHASLQAGAQPVLLPNAAAPVRVNGVPCSGPTPLQPDDELMIGSTRLIYRQRSAQPSGTTQRTLHMPMPAREPTQTQTPTQTQSQPNCPHCGAILKPGVKFCGACGKRLAG